MKRVRPARRFNRGEAIAYLLTGSPAAANEVRSAAAEAAAEGRAFDALGYLVVTLALQTTYAKKGFEQDKARVARRVRAADKRFDDAVADGRLSPAKDGRVLVADVKALRPGRKGPGRGRPRKRSHDFHDLMVLAADFVSRSRPAKCDWTAHAESMAKRLKRSDYDELRPAAMRAAEYETRSLCASRSHLRRRGEPKIEQSRELGAARQPPAEMGSAVSF